MRRISSLFLAACFCVFLVGCGGDAATTEEPAVSAPENADAGSDEKMETMEAAADGSEEKEEAPAEE